MRFKHSEWMASLALMCSMFTLIGMLYVASPLVFGATNQQSDIDRTVVQPNQATAISNSFNYQGILRNGDGQLLTGVYTMTLKIYSSVTGGSPLFTQTTNNVNVKDGVFNVVLGNSPGNPLGASVFANAPRYLGIAIIPDVEMTPRQEIHAVPWALVASQAITADIAAHALHSDLASTAQVLPALGIIPGQPTFQNIAFQGICFGCGRKAVFAKNVSGSILQPGIGVKLNSLEFVDFQDGPFPTVTAGGAFGFVIGRADLQEIDVNGRKMKSLVATSFDAHPDDYVGILTEGYKLARICSPYPSQGPFYDIYGPVRQITLDGTVVISPAGCVIATVVDDFLNSCPTSGGGICPEHVRDYNLMWMTGSFSTAIAGIDTVNNRVWIK